MINALRVTMVRSLKKLRNYFFSLLVKNSLDISLIEFAKLIYYNVKRSNQYHVRLVVMVL